MDPATVAAATEVINKLLGLSAAGALMLAGWMSYKGIWVWGSQLTEQKDLVLKTETKCQARVEKLESQLEHMTNIVLQMGGIAEKSVSIASREKP